MSFLSRSEASEHPFGPDAALFAFFVALAAESRGLAAFLVLLLAYALLETQKSRWPRLVFMGKLGVLYFASMAALLGMGGLNIAARADYLFGDAGPVEALAGKTHDGMKSSEDATRLFLSGENPYTADFSSTDMHWIPSPIVGEPNPALTHYVYQPAMFILPAPFKGLIESVLGYFDARIFYFACFMAGMLVLPSFGSDRLSKLGLVMVMGLNMSLIAFTAEGRNDIVGLVLMLLAWLPLVGTRRRVELSAALMGLACATKQSTWFMVPFLFIYALGEEHSREAIMRTLRRMWPLLVIAAVFMAPYLLWNPGAYIEDTLLFQSGALPGGYPIFGFSLARLMVEIGVLEGYRAAWPALLFHAAFTLPVLAILLRWQWKRNRMSTAWAGYGLFLIVYGFFSYFFNNNLITFAITCMLIAYWARPPREALRLTAAGS